jgi:hypothetical protein
VNEKEKHGLGVALNEASLLGVEVSRARGLAAITMDVLTLPESGGPPPQDSRVSILLRNVGRVAVSLRGGLWNDLGAPIMPLTLEQLLPTVQSFGGQPVYGWEFIDVDCHANDEWMMRLSLDERIPGGSVAHHITLFQEGVDRHLDFRIWFAELEVYRPDHTSIALDDFIASGQRWWDALHKGDPRTDGRGIMPAGPG